MASLYDHPEQQNKSCEALDAKRINNRVVEGIARNLRIASTTPPTTESAKT